MSQSVLYLEIAKILTYSSLAFIIGLWAGSYLIAALVWLKFWKKKPRNTTTTGEKLVVTKSFYEENEKKRLIPRAGGLLISITSLSFALFFWVILKMDPENKTFQFLNFVSRRQTFIPFATMFFGACFGLIDDALSTMESGGNYQAGGLKLSHRLYMVTILSVAIGWWFGYRLDINSLNFFGYDIPLFSPLLVIFTTVFTLVGLWGTSVIDGIDGLAGGVFVPIYICFAGLAFVRGFYDISTFMMVIVGSMVAYLWYNVAPAKFILGDTGSLCLVLTLGSVAILTDTLYLLPIAAIMPVLTALSNIIQIFSKKVFKRKVFLAAPLHHHLEAIGWSRGNIVVRYWIISLLSSVIAFSIGIILV